MEHKSDGQMSELGALEQEAKELQKFKWADTVRDEYHHRIDSLFTMNNDERRREIEVMLTEPPFLNLCSVDTGFLTMLLIMKAYIREAEAGERYTAFDIVGNMEDVLLLLDEIKFNLWRIEFRDDEQAKRMIVLIVKDMNVSPHLLHMAIETSAFFKTRLLEALADIFFKKYMIRYSYYILRYLFELQPGNEEAACALAHTCILLGDTAAANKYLSGVGKDNPTASAMREKYGL